MKRGPAEIAVACEAAALLSGVVLAFTLAPPHLHGRLVRSACRESKDHRDRITPAEVEEVTLAVTRAARRVPRSTCLAQALVGWWMLKRRAGASVVRMGVTRERGILSAHAWLERDGRILLGAESADRHVEFPPQP